MIKLDIVEIIQGHVELRRAGKELVGLCPFHDDRHASFYVNPQKQVFLCRSCQTGGDVIRFIMLIEHVSFAKATKLLGIGGGTQARPKLTPRRKRAVELAATWVNEQSAKLNALITEAWKAAI